MRRSATASVESSDSDSMHHYVGTTDVVGDEADGGGGVGPAPPEDEDDEEFDEFTMVALDEVADELHESGAESSTLRLNSDMSASRCCWMKANSIS